ncbi:dihydrolipoamide acetyltransferase family protein [Blattabacterium cuenoti]|uniref:dihydrolipoamide acetyltransferase family protein n=1 Tax=Blattabacterium cuenoti TaxID=1653831 RepID=UPI00163BEF9D|nr:dihydrolipoamide acetyltransferase family protein [Blattabacterium cuenoti]
MAEIISMPQLSDTMEEGTVVKWNKKIGDKVIEGDIIAEIETDKAIQDFEIDISGILLFIGVKEGETTKVNDLLAIIGEKGEDINHLIKKNKTIKSISPIIGVKEGEKKKVNDLLAIIGEKGEDINHLIKKNKTIKSISPIAKKIAKQKNISLKNVKGTGDHGRIIKRDIESITEYKKNNKVEKIPQSSIRKIIAKRLANSKFSAPHYYLFVDLNVDRLVDLRKKFNKKLSIEERISFNDILIKIAAQSLKINPEMNVSWTDEYILSHKEINIGFAVAIENGLIVPVIRNADKKSILEISKEIKEKIIRSQSKKIDLEELEYSTFTVSNLGMYGIDSFTSIINTPNSSILSIGSIRKRPIVNNSNNQIEIGNVMKITLSCDHRIIDGALASNYIKSFKEYIENPITILL